MENVDGTTPTAVCGMQASEEGGSGTVLGRTRGSTFNVLRSAFG